MAKRTLTDEREVENYSTIHPALDFYEGKALLAVGTKMQRTYEIESESKDGKEKQHRKEVEFDNKPIIVTSSYEKFIYSKLNLAERKLFYTGSTIDPPSGRWSRSDIDNFLNTRIAPTWVEAFNLVQKEFVNYLDFVDQRLYMLFPIFTLYTYFYPIFNGAPILHLWGNFKTGKTKICSLLDCMCFNPINSANISSATIFRVIESRRATVLLDENEEVGTERAKEIRNMLLSGTGKSGQTYRQEKNSNDNFRTQSYKVFSPKVIAHITGIDSSALSSRTIRVTTIGGSDMVKMNAEVDIEDWEYWQPVRAPLYRLCLSRYRDVYKIKDQIIEENLAGRTLSLWKGMLSIAMLVGLDTYNACLEYANDNKNVIESETEDADDSPKVIANALLGSMDGENPVRITTNKVFNILQSAANFTNKRDMARELGRLGIHNMPLKNAEGKSERFYVLDKNYLYKIAGNR
jgi:hypothetical protein